MESLIESQVRRVIADFEEGTEHFDGVIYMMYWADPEAPIPLYIGKAEKYGKKGRNLSAYLVNIERNHSKFCRWGYNYAYHIGDLSAAVCDGHRKEKRNAKYERWAERLFEVRGTSTPRLVRETFLWAKAWSQSETGIWKEFGSTTLTFLEYLLIGVANKAYTDTLLNQEGTNRF